MSKYPMTVDGLIEMIAEMSASLDRIDANQRETSALVGRLKAERDEARHLCGEWRDWARRLHDGATDWMSEEEECFPWGDDD